MAENFALRAGHLPGDSEQESRAEDPQPLGLTLLQQGWRRLFKSAAGRYRARKEKRMKAQGTGESLGGWGGLEGDRRGAERDEEREKQGIRHSPEWIWACSLR